MIEKPSTKAIIEITIDPVPPPSSLFFFFTANTIARIANTAVTQPPAIPKRIVQKTQVLIYSLEFKLFMLENLL